MKDDGGSKAVVLLVAALAAFQMIHYYPLMPGTMVVHFGTSGAPNGWSARPVFIATFGATEALIVLLGLALPSLIGRIPADFINIPNRQYWLASERRDESVSFIRTQVMWMETATLVFLMAIAQIIFTLNLSGAPRRLPGDFWIVAVAFVAVIVWFAARIMLRFRIPKSPGV
jgi:uncharacterized membrane protein